MVAVKAFVRNVKDEVCIFWRFLKQIAPFVFLLISFLPYTYSKHCWFVTKMNLDKLSCCFNIFPIDFCPFSLFGAASQSPFQDVLHHSQKTLLALCIAALYLSNINREITSLASNTEFTLLSGDLGGNWRKPPDREDQTYLYFGDFCRPRRHTMVKVVPHTSHAK